MAPDWLSEGCWSFFDEGPSEWPGEEHLCFLTCAVLPHLHHHSCVITPPSSPVSTCIITPPAHLRHHSTCLPASSLHSLSGDRYAFVRVRRCLQPQAASMTMCFCLQRLALKLCSLHSCSVQVYVLWSLLHKRVHMSCGLCCTGRKLILVATTERSHTLSSLMSVLIATDG